MLNKFLDEVCSHIHCKAVHKEIRAELAGHIEELQNEGMTLEESISAMGDCTEIGIRLDKQHRPRIEWPLIGLVVLISAIGMAMMFFTPDRVSFLTDFFGRQLLWSGIGVVFAIAIMFIDYGKIKAWALPLYIAAVLFLINARARMDGAVFLSIGGLTLSSSGAILPFFLAFVGFMDRFRGEGLRGVIKLMFLELISIIMMLLVLSIPTSLILLVSYTVLLFAAIWKNHFNIYVRAYKIILCVGNILIAGFVIFFVINSPYRLNRLIGFITHADPAGEGWINMQLAKLLSLSKWWGGAGTVDGFPVHNLLPNLHTDFALANVIVTFGWIAGITLILAIVALIVRFFMVIRKIKDNFGFYLALASCVVLTIQFIISVLMNLGLFPVTGVGLPFVSYGGTAYISNMMLVGIVLSVWRRNNIMAREDERTPKMCSWVFSRGKPAR